jgi:hypothetical protein
MKGNENGSTHKYGRKCEIFCSFLKRKGKVSKRRMTE